MKHGVDSLTELSTASLVDAACVHPRVSDAGRLSESTRLLDFPPSLFRCETCRTGDILEINFVVTPSVRKDSIFWKIGLIKLYGMETLCRSVE
jgi:hypothetical protein